MSAAVTERDACLIAKAEEILERRGQQDLADQIDDVLYAVEEAIEWCQDAVAEADLDSAACDQQLARATAAIEQLRIMLGVEP